MSDNMTSNLHLSEIENQRLREENSELRSLIRQMGFNADKLLAPPDDMCKNILLRSIALDETALRRNLGKKVDIDLWRKSWTRLRS